MNSKSSDERIGYSNSGHGAVARELFFFFLARKINETFRNGCVRIRGRDSERVPGLQAVPISSARFTHLASTFVVLGDDNDNGATTSEIFL